MYTAPMYRAVITRSNLACFTYLTLSFMPLSFTLCYVLELVKSGRRVLRFWEILRTFKITSMLPGKES